MGARIRLDLVGSVHVDNQLGQRVVLTAGQAVPDGFTVGEHVLEGGRDAEPVAAPSPPRPAAERAPSTDGATDTPAAPSAPAAPVKKAAAKRAVKSTAKKAPAKKSTAKKATGR